MRQHLAEGGRRAVRNQKKRNAEFGKAGWVTLHSRVPCTDRVRLQCVQPSWEEKIQTFHQRRKTRKRKARN